MKMTDERLKIMAAIRKSGTFRNIKAQVKLPHQKILSEISALKIYGLIAGPSGDYVLTAYGKETLDKETKEPIQKELF